MKKIIMIMMIALGTTLQAQTFDFSCNPFGDMGNFFPGTNYEDEVQDLANSTRKYQLRAKLNSNYNTTFPTETITEGTHEFAYGSSAIFTRTYTAVGVYTTASSNNPAYDSKRINGGEFHGFVLVDNKTSYDVFAKWSHNSNVIETVLVIHTISNGTNHKAFSYGPYNTVRPLIYLHGVSNVDLDN